MPSSVPSTAGLEGKDGNSIRQMVIDIEGFDIVRDGRYRHARTGVLFTLVPAAGFVIGMSEAEEQLLRSRPSDLETDMVDHFLEEHLRFARLASGIHLSPSLIADFPLTVQFVTDRWGFAGDQFSHVGAAYVPDYRTVAPLLNDLGFRLPSESEWEYCHRHFSPLHDLPGKEMLQLTPAAKIGDFRSYAEICADAWSPTLSEIPNDGSPRPGDGPRVVRGGAANLYPWQGCGEWLGLLPYCRYSEEQGELLSVRPAVSISEEA